MRPDHLTDIRLLAHQGGWDEIGLVAVPLAVVATLLWVADRRARRLTEHPKDED
ncbi:MAG: hypothetical protein H8D48_00190 [Actinobacteria bacterium]|nr:hypothetical protein [Actinomycetota bacterium]MBT4677628.1 hypothetical protein [Acidimicrobiaceae bacterium]MBT5206851.1 hypothetical protein [Acidimicrobiaceae bacterium]MBT5567524.1 hypothetical protein [Acidimicrobiaceae bacterium]